MQKIQHKINEMLDQKIKSRLLSLLRLGASDQIHEADTALSKAVQMMEKHGITIDDLLDQIGASELPQSVCADLARRYCLTRPDMGPTARDEYYRAVFLRIAERYAPEAKLTNTKKPTASPESGGQAGKRGRSDWKSRMDDTRRASAGNRHEQTREEASQQYRRYSPRPAPIRPTETLKNRFFPQRSETPHKLLACFLCAASMPSPVGLSPAFFWLAVCGKPTFISSIASIGLTPFPLFRFLS